MTEGLTDWARNSRLTVIEVLKESGLVRVRDAAEQCTAVSCGEGALVLSDDVAPGGLEALGPGDVIRVEREAGAVRKIVVVRRSWDEITSPEF